MHAPVELVVGASFSNHTGIATYKTLVCIDDTPMSVGRFASVDVSVLADAGLALAAMDTAIGPDVQAQNQRPDVAARLELWRAEKARRALDDRGKGCRPPRYPTCFPALHQRRPSSRSTWATMLTPWGATWSPKVSRF